MVTCLDNQHSGGRDGISRASLTMQVRSNSELWDQHEVLFFITKVVSKEGRHQELILGHYRTHTHAYPPTHTCRLTFKHACALHTHVVDFLSPVVSLTVP